MTALPNEAPGPGPGAGPHQDPGPGAGARAPRTWGASDAPSLNLSGEWRFRLSPRADADPGFADPAFDDRGWDRLPVPSHWQLHGHGPGCPATTPPATTG